MVRGFTLVELLIVIVVIAILAAISVIGYSGIQLRANASVMTDYLIKTEKALRLYATDQNWLAWPTDDLAVDGVNGNPRIYSDFIQKTSFKNYLQNKPQLSAYTSSYLYYDNDGDTRTNCTSIDAGANITVTALDNTLASEINRIIDNDNSLTCGKVRFSNNSGNLYYGLSNTSAF